jgi:hypothetical protein
MNLAQIIKIKEEQPFFYKGEKTKIEWREKTDEMVGTTKDGIEMWLHHFAICFRYKNDLITLRSMHPSPAIVDMPNYSI